MAKRMKVAVTIVSAQDLKNVKVGCFGGKMSPFAVAWTTSGITNSARKTTPPSTKGGRHPAWNSKQTFYCEEDSITKGLENLTIELWHKSFIKKKLLGMVEVPLASEYQSDTPKPLTNEVVLSPGKKQGILNFSVKISDVPVPKPYVPPPPKTKPSSSKSVGGGAGGVATAAAAGLVAGTAVGAAAGCGGVPGDGGGGSAGGCGGGGSAGGCGGGCGG